MGKHCQVCHKVQSNEHFSGHGLRKSICNTCQKVPEDKQNLLKAKEEIIGYWNQNTISEANIKRLEKLKNSPFENIQKLAHLTVEVAVLKPHKARRMPWLRKHHRDLFMRVMAYFKEGYDEDEDQKIFGESITDAEEHEIFEFMDFLPF
jgi:hypothetical protein